MIFFWNAWSILHITVFVEFACNCLHTAHSYFPTNNRIHYFVLKNLFMVQLLSITMQLFTASLSACMVLYTPNSSCLTSPIWNIGLSSLITQILYPIHLNRQARKEDNSFHLYQMSFKMGYTALLGCLLAQLIIKEV